MKVTNKLAVLLGVSALLAVSASAKTTEQAYLENCLKAPGVPVPVAVVSPSKVSSDYAGSKVEVAFTVDSKGAPTEMSVVSAPDALVARVVLDAIKQWKFNPATKNGVAVAQKVLLPVIITDEETAFAAK